MLKKFKVFFKRNNGEYIDLGFSERKDCLNVVNNFLEKYNFKCYYIRTVRLKEGVEFLDVGSYGEFFYVVAEEELKNFIRDKKIIKNQIMDIE